MTWRRSNAHARFSQLLDILPSSLESKNIWLDIGTGSELFANILTTKFPNVSVLGSDKRLPQNIRFPRVQAYLEFHPFRKHSFAGIICGQVLHFIPSENQVKVINTLSNSLVEKGYIVIIEYEISRSYSWIPYPLALDWLKRKIRAKQLMMKLITYKRIQDGHRPKFSVLLQRI
ncbi:MAG: methyltransferase domain-containing protein [Candidatus Kariarchaeaceae archaeon]|jgi:hypothetical protein